MMHIVNKQIIDLKLHKKLNAFRMQHLVSEHYWKQIVPLLEKVFDTYANGDEVLRFDTLEIDLGTISEKELEKNNWDDAFLAKINERITESIAATAVKERLAAEQKVISVCRQWLFYMQHGYLHWNTLEITDKWYETVLETLATDFKQVAELRRLIKQDKNVSARIIQQHSDQFLLKLTEVLTAQSQKNLSAAIDEIVVVLKLVGSQKNLLVQNGQRAKALLWQRAIDIAATATAGLTTGKIISLLLNLNKDEFQTAQAVKAAAISAVEIISAPLKQLLASIEHAARNEARLPDETLQKSNPQEEKKKRPEGEKPSVKNKKENTDHPDGQNTTKQVGEEQSTDASFNISDNRLTDDQQTAFAEIELPELKAIAERWQDVVDNTVEPSIKEAITADGIFIQHAGIVLVHPFLSTLFNRLELIKEKNFVHLQARQKALYLLHYLATGSREAEEYELVMPKLLCGYPLHIPVQKEIELTTVDLAEADDMLIACIQRWEKINNTSLAALREGFLQRKGKLSFKDDCPYLQIETSGIDVLLDYLPWNIGIIKLPWLKELIRVEWR